MDSEQFQLPKTLFTEADFETMGWHDNPIHAVAFGPGANELSFDIDYIFKWEQPLLGQQGYRFWISPATLVFENVYHLEADYSEPQDSDILLLNVLREAPDPTRFRPTEPPMWQWTLDCFEGAWEFLATGYRQFIRQPPVLLDVQRLTHVQRGGYNFDCPPRP